MAEPTVEHLFERYRGRGDVDALGAVFDRTAAGLLRVAVHLVPDPAAAEDLVQATFLKAIEAAWEWDRSRPLEPWLLGVLRHLGQQRRWREGRVPDAARVRQPEVDDPLAVAQNRELSAALDRAIEELPEPYRPVLRMRLGYGHHPAQIAHVLDRPAATVRVQLARGLSMLRGKLPAGFVATLGIALLPERGLAAVKSALLGFAAERAAATATAAAVATATTTTTTIVPVPLGVLMMKKSLAALVLLAIACGIWFNWSGSADPADPGPEVGDPAAAARTGDPGSVPPAAAAKSAEGPASRVAVPEEHTRAAVDPDKVGHLVVRVRWSDGTPAPDVAVGLTSLRPVHHAIGRQVTGAGGVARFQGLAPGAALVTTDRGGQANAEVTAGKGTEVTVDLEGIDVQGVVVDGAGQPLPDAGIWLTSQHTDWMGGRVVTRSDSSGGFQLRGVPKDQSLGALVRGKAPSALVDLDDLDTTKPPVQVRIVVTEPGGSVRGIVLSPQGEPLHGGRVCVGSRPGHFLSRRGSRGYIETWTPLVAVTGADGRFEFSSVAPGEHPVAVRAAGLPIWNGSVTVQEDQESRVEVRLPQGAVIHGVVKDAGGAPIGGAVVRAYPVALDESFIQGGQFDYDHVLGFPFASADEQGRYRVTEVAPGEVHLYATRRRERGHTGTLMRAKAVMPAKAGDELEWNPVIGPGHHITGRVTYKNGTPMKHVFVSLHDRSTGLRQSLVNDPEGRFRFTNLLPTAYEVSVQYRFDEVPRGAPPLQKEGVWPDREELLLEATFDVPLEKKPGIVRGRIDDAGRRRQHPGNFGVLLRSDRNFWHTERADERGAFEFKRVSPGRYRLIVMSGECQIHTGEWFEVAPAQTVDAGTLVTRAGGAFRFRLRRAAGAAEIEPRLSISHVDTGEWRSVKPGTKNEHVESSFSVGKYRIQTSGEGVMRTTADAEIFEGGETVVEITVRAGLPRVFNVRWPKDAERVTFKLTDASGAAVFDMSFKLSVSFPNPYAPRLFLAPGRYRVEASLDDGRRIDRQVEVGAEPGEVAPIELDLARQG